MTSYTAVYGKIYPSNPTDPGARLEGYWGVAVRGLPEGAENKAATTQDEDEATARRIIHEATGEAPDEIQLNVEIAPVRH